MHFRPVGDGDGVCEPQLVALQAELAAGLVRVQEGESDGGKKQKFKLLIIAVDLLLGR